MTLCSKGEKSAFSTPKKCSGGKLSGCTSMKLEKLLTPYRVRSFRTVIYAHYQLNRRKLPWRRTTDPYRILVSEIMLQQTQVDRVTEKYQQFIALFPDVVALGSAPLAEVLRAWQGLGYNRRAIALHNAAKFVTDERGGRIPDTAEALSTLPGVGRYTAAAVMAFAYNQPVVFVETNIRAVFIHFFFNDQDQVADKEILPLVERTLDRKEPRNWYNALMDYGTLLKKKHGNPAKKSAHYQKQSTFRGSDRQLRGQILKTVLDTGSMTEQQILKQLNSEQSRAVAILNKLIAEGFLVRKQRRIIPA
ncbi:MAG: endonuclease III [Thermodesulfovibrio sp.]|nr:endonuclease III [Thermodesulfovibrio sp.]